MIHVGWGTDTYGAGNVGPGGHDTCRYFSVILGLPVYVSFRGCLHVIETGRVRPAERLGPLRDFLTRALGWSSAQARQLPPEIHLELRPSLALKGLALFDQLLWLVGAVAVIGLLATAAISQQPRDPFRRENLLFLSPFWACTVLFVIALPLYRLLRKPSRRQAGIRAAVANRLGLFSDPARWTPDLTVRAVPLFGPLAAKPQTVLDEAERRRKAGNPAEALVLARLALGLLERGDDPDLAGRAEAVTDECLADLAAGGPTAAWGPEREGMILRPEAVIHLTPSARRRARASREAWGWQPGLPVLISRTADGLAFGVPYPGVGPLVAFTSRKLRFAVPASEADYFQGSILSFNFDSLYGEPRWWLTNPNDPGRSACSDPLGASCSPEKFRRLHPELFDLTGVMTRLRGGYTAEDREQLLARTSAFLRLGDGRAAVVVQTDPLVVAAYCDEMDAAILLRFPAFLVRQYALAEGARLVTANLQRPGPGPLAADLVPGPACSGRYTNVRPLIADFLAAEDHLVEARRRSLTEQEYRRCAELGRKALRAGQPIRSGRPLEAGTPGRR